jgi:hypothetical protein
MGKWEREYARLSSRFKLAWIQKYPKKNSPPIILADNS